MKLLETREILNQMLYSKDTSKKQKEAIERALVEVDITIDNGDESNSWLIKIKIKGDINENY